MPLTGTFIGRGVAPRVLSATALSPQTVLVVFNENMLANAALILPANYFVTPDVGSAARAVTLVVAQGTPPGAVLLTLDGNLTPGINNYRVTVSNVRDVANNLIDAAFDEADFGGPQNDFSAPFLTNQDPEPFQIAVPLASNIVFDVIDPDSGIALASVNVTVDDSTSSFDAVIAGVIQAPYTGSIVATTGGYTVTLNPPVDFAENLVITVFVQAADNALPAANLLDTSYYFFTFPEALGVPTPALAVRRSVALIGSIIQLDARESREPSNAPLVFTWRFVSVPMSSVLVADVGLQNPASITPIVPGFRAISYIPDVIGTYVLELTVSNGFNSSSLTATATIGLSLVPSGEASTIPNLSFLWQFLSSFWSLVEDREYLQVLWEVIVQATMADLVTMWSVDSDKSLASTQSTAVRRWQKFPLRTLLADTPQSVIVGNCAAGVSGDSGPLRRTSDELTRVFRVPLRYENFTTLNVDYGISGRVFIVNDQAFIADRAYNQSAVRASIDRVLTFDGVTLEDISVAADDDADATPIWQVLGDQVLVVAASSFNALRFVFEVVASSALSLVFEVSDGAGGWVAFIPTSDGTNDGQQDGVIEIDEAAQLTAGWAPQDVDGQAGYALRISRNAAVVTTPPSVLSILEQEDYSFLGSTDVAIPNNQRNVPYRVPHLLHTPEIDLEDLGVSAGDVLVLEISRKDTGLSAELQAQVVGVVDNRLGFEFDLAALELDAVSPVDHALFRQLVQDLHVVHASASDVDIAAVAEAFIQLIPTGVNLAQRPWSEFQFQVRAKEVIHNSSLRIDERYVSIPTLQFDIRTDPEVVYLENTDYSISDGYLVFRSGLFTLLSTSPEELWAEQSHVDNSETVENNFGRIVGLRRSDLAARATRAPYLAAVKGLWYALMQGPSVANLRLALQILMGLPFSEARGVIIAITPNFTTDSASNSISRLLVEDVDAHDRPTGTRRFYFYPEAVGLETNPNTGATYAVDDIVEAFTPLSLGVEVNDWINTPDWWVRALVGEEVKKYHSFRAQIDTQTGVFNENDLVFSIQFLRSIRPIYTDVLAAVVQRLEDENIMDDFEETLAGTAMTARFYDNVGSIGRIEVAFSAGRTNQQGIVLWGADSRPFRTVSSLLRRDVVTAANGSNVEASSASGFGTAVRSRVAGDASHPVIEGDILVILAGQHGAGSHCHGFYEFTSGTFPGGPAILGNVASLRDPLTWVVSAPDAAQFQYGSALRCSVLRRAANPVVRGADLVTTAGVPQPASSALAAFRNNGVAIDDHLVIEAGANLGEYRIVSIVAQTSPRTLTPVGVPQISNTAIALVALNGSNVVLTNLSSQNFRVIRPSMMRLRVRYCRVVQSGGNMFLECLDFGGGSEPFDVFTPGMVNQATARVSRAENPLNDGLYTILEYIHAGRVRITTGSPQTSDASPTAYIVITSRWHPGFERAHELSPTEAFSAVVS